MERPAPVELPASRGKKPPASNLRRFVSPLIDPISEALDRWVPRWAYRWRGGSRHFTKHRYQPTHVPPAR